MFQQERELSSSSMAIPALAMGAPSRTLDLLQDAAAFVETHGLDPISVCVATHITIELLPPALSAFAVPRSLDGVFRDGWISVRYAGMVLRARV